MNRLSKLAGLILVLVVMSSGVNLQVYAQNSSDDLNPQTQKYIDNLNEVQQAANDGKSVNGSSSNPVDKGPSVWSFVFYGFLSGAAWAFWRWLKKLKNGG